MSKKKKREWCQTEAKHLTFFGTKEVPKYKKRQRCPNCNRLLNVFLKECSDPGCQHLWLPPHKGKFK
jgi:hypothetical protein